MALKFSSVGGGGQVEQKTYPAGTTAERPASPEAGELFYDTTIGGLMIYNGVAWSTFLTPAAVTAPSSPVATNVGTDRPFNNAAASVAFTPSSELGGVATLYTVTSSPSGITGTGTSSPVIVSGLQSNTSYTFTVKASNSYSNATSASTNSVTVTSTPGAPSLGTATDTAAGGQVSIPVNSVDNGGSAITNYQWSTDGTTYTALSPAQTTSPIVVSGLTNNQSYTIRLKAVNANGAGTASSPSNSVTPSVAYFLSQTFNTSGTYTVPAGAVRMAIYTMGGGGGGGNSRGSQGAVGGFGGYGSGVIVNSVTPGTTYNVTVGAAGAGTGTGWGATGGVPTQSSFGNLINSGSPNGVASGTGVVAGNAQGAAQGAAGNPVGGTGGSGGNIVLTNATGFGAGLPNAVQYGGGGGGGGGCSGSRAGGSGGSPFGGSGGGGQSQATNDPYNGEFSCCYAGSGGAGNGPGGGGGSGGQACFGDEYRGSGASGAPGRVLVYVRNM